MKIKVTVEIESDHKIDVVNQTIHIDGKDDNIVITTDDNSLTDKVYIKDAFSSKDQVEVHSTKTILG